MAAGDFIATKPPTIGKTLAKKRHPPEAVVEHVGEGDDLIAGMGNSEPVTVLDAIEADAERLSGVRIHQMLPFRERRYMHGHLLASTTSLGFSPRLTARPSTKGRASWCRTTSARCRL